MSWWTSLSLKDVMGQMDTVVKYASGKVARLPIFNEQFSSLNFEELNAKVDSSSEAAKGDPDSLSSRWDMNMAYARKRDANYANASHIFLRAKGLHTIQGGLYKAGRDNMIIQK